MPTLSHQAYTFDPRPNYPFLITAKRYWRPSPVSVPPDPTALTLVLAHGNGFHKEHWEPSIDELYSLLDEGPTVVKIREVWSIDAPNHGDAAILNEEILQCYRSTCTSRYPSVCRSCHCYRHSFCITQLVGRSMQEVYMHSSQAWGLELMWTSPPTNSLRSVTRWELRLCKSYFTPPSYPRYQSDISISASFRPPTIPSSTMPPSSSSNLLFSPLG
jgi:hypothetical protein